jgi:hypothetical protein
MHEYRAYDSYMNDDRAAAALDARDFALRHEGCLLR